MELRLRSTVDEDEDRPPMKQIYDFLKEFATTEPELPTTTAMERLDNLASQAEADSIDAYTFLMRFWEILVPLAYQLPYNHPSQARMAQLIAAFAERGHDVGSDGDAGTLQARWPRLHGLDEHLQDIWAEPSESTTEPPIKSQWVNLNSFTARVIGSSLSVSYRFPIWTMRYSFEGHGGGSVALRQMRLLAAAQWMIYGAPDLLAFMQQQQSGSGFARGYESQFFKAQDVWSMKRWLYWKQGFQDAAEEGEYSDEVRAAAKSAVQAMEEPERH